MFSPDVPDGILEDLFSGHLDGTPVVESASGHLDVLLMDSLQITSVDTWRPTLKRDPYELLE